MGVEGAVIFFPTFLACRELMESFYASIEVLNDGAEPKVGSKFSASSWYGSNLMDDMALDDQSCKGPLGFEWFWVWIQFFLYPN